MRLTSRGAAIAAFALAVSFGLTGVARAGTIQLFDDPATYTGGEGEFGVNPANFTGLNPPLQAFRPVVSGYTTPLFTTFCLEKSEGVNIHHQRSVAFTGGTALPDVSTGMGDQTVYQWALNTAAVGGGAGGAVNGQDPLDARTAYLYTQFYNGLLSNYDYTLGSGTLNGAGNGFIPDHRLLSSASLSNAIYFIEDELGASFTLANLDTMDHQAWLWVTEANSKVASGAWTGLGNVRVLNLFTIGANGSIDNAQDVLVMVPLPPAAWLGLGLMSAMGAVGIIRRRRRQALA